MKIIVADHSGLAGKRGTIAVMSPWWTIVLVIAVAGTAAAENLRTNWREECRSAIAGQYLTLVDQVKHDTDYATIVDRELKGLRAERDKARKSAEQARQHSINDDFNVRREEAAAAAQYRMRTIEEQIVTNESLLSDAQQKIREAQNQATALEPRMLKVFKMEKILATHEGGYTFRIDYISPCPIYQLLCPLPRSQAIDLKALLPPTELPVACERYANIAANIGG